MNATLEPAHVYIYKRGISAIEAEFFFYLFCLAKGKKENREYRVIRRRIRFGCVCIYV